MVSAPNTFAILSQVDPKTLGLNLWLIISGVFCLGVSTVLILVFWTAIKVWLSERRERRSWERYQKSSRRADGRPYPAFFMGQCDSCGRGHRKIYQAEWGPGLCPTCYEAAWPAQTRKRVPPDSPEKR